MRFLKLGLVLLLLAGVLWLLLAPIPIEPAVYSPAPGMPLTGPLAPDRALADAELLGVGQLVGPEDVAVDEAGRIYGGTIDGRIVRLSADGATIETFAETGGRPLGLAWAADGRLLVADGIAGLLAVDEQGAVETLSTGADGVPFRFTDDLDVAQGLAVAEGGPAAGTVFFTDASSKFGPDEYLFDLLEARPHGRFLRYDPATGTTTVLLDGLYFANGVALASDESFVLVNETYRYRIRRYWLTGPRAGQDEIFIDNLPGFPDGVASDREGRFWVAMFTVRNDLMDRLHPHPWAKSVLARLPRFLWPQPAPYGLALELDEEGNVLGSLHDPDGERVPNITSVEPVGDQLYLGTLKGEWLGRVGR